MSADNRVSAETKGLSRGEARIRRAFIRSVLALVVLALSVGGTVLWFQFSGKSTEVVNEVAVKAPENILKQSATTPPSVQFKDITGEAGIQFEHHNGATGDKLMPETMGGGVAFLDYDMDGDQDLFLVNFKSWSEQADKARPVQALYENDGTGRFTDVTVSVGLDLSLYGMAVTVGDYDNDGDPDLFLSNLGSNLLLRNDLSADGKRHFVDVTAEAKVAGRDNEYSSGAAFLDYDNDGDLDLFVINYVEWSRELDRSMEFRLTGNTRAYVSPSYFPGVDNYLYRNEGNGQFTDVSATAKITIKDPVTDQAVGKALGIMPVDYDRDGWMDILIANDMVRNFLFRNQGDGTFEEIGTVAGVAYDRQGRTTGAMGIDAAYFRNNTDLGVAIGNFANEMSSLYVSMDGQVPFVDEATLEGLGSSTRLSLTFGVFFLDYDLDGRLDLFHANGHLEPEINEVQNSQHYAQPPQLFWNCGDACRAHFIEVNGAGDMQQPLVGRGAAYADIDQDGDLDIAVVQNGGKAVLLRNDQALGHHWLRVRLEGVKAHRDAIGAKVKLTAGGITQQREVMLSRSYASQVEPVLTFGLGEATKVDSLVVEWPGGGKQEISVPVVDQLLVVKQQ